MLKAKHVAQLVSENCAKALCFWNEAIGAPTKIHRVDLYVRLVNLARTFTSPFASPQVRDGLPPRIVAIRATLGVCRAPRLAENDDEIAAVCAGGAGWNCGRDPQVRRIALRQRFVPNLCLALKRLHKLAAVQTGRSLGNHRFENNVRRCPEHRNAGRRLGSRHRDHACRLAATAECRRCCQCKDEDNENLHATAAQSETISDGDYWSFIGAHVPEPFCPSLERSTLHTGP